MNAPRTGPHRRQSKSISTLVVILGSLVSAVAQEAVTPHLQLVRGPVNGALISTDGRTAAVYGDPRSEPAKADTVLLTHFRRDVTWAARGLADRGARVVAPEAEAGLIQDAKAFWGRQEQARFHDYAQTCTKVLASPIPVAQTVRPGESISWAGLSLRVLQTPGYTRESVTYLTTLDGQRIAFCGDLMHGEGGLLDLYSFQDAIPDAKIGGYHGYAARLAELIASLRRLAAEKPDLIVPARGPAIRKPRETIDALIQRVEMLYSNYLSTDALRWYFGDGHVRAKAARVLGPDASIDWMPMGETNSLPAWVVAIDNTRLIRSASGAGFLVDCGSRSILDRLKKMKTTGELSSVDFVFISHYHDDHTDQVPALVKEFGSTVLACHELWDVLERPDTWAIPCLTRHPIHVSGRLAEGARWRWNEFELQAWYFPGQTLYHQALLVTKDQGESICFVGDSFTPSGLDDYCLQNRNLLHPDAGYFRCLSRVRNLPANCWLVNQHVGPMFRFTATQLDRMQAALQSRVELLAGLFPWDDVNYGLDASWARLHPYALQAASGRTNSCRAIVWNHSPKERVYRIRANLPVGWRLVEGPGGGVRIPPRQEGGFEFSFVAPAETSPGLYVITADVRNESEEFREWIEALVRVSVN